DPAALAFIREVIDHQRARQAFAASADMRHLWPAALAEQTLPFFEHQGAINRIMWEGANPLRHIEELHELLTRTPLRTLPLWELGRDASQQVIGDAASDETGLVAYTQGLRALVDRNYRAAIGDFAKAERLSLEHAPVRPLLAYSLCLAGNLDAARK